MPDESRPIQCDCPWDGCGKPVPIIPGEEVYVKDVLCPHCGQWCQTHSAPSGGERLTLRKKAQ
jgi:hypothetical protein